MRYNPEFVFHQGSPYNRSDLRAVNVDTADMCIILTPGIERFGSHEHSALSDKEVILVTLNLKGMRMMILMLTSFFLVSESV